MMHDEVVDKNGTVGHPTRAIPPGTEYLIAWMSQGLDSKPTISIYGNPVGLRRLAQMLISIADYDQAIGDFPDNDRLHCHVSTGRNTESHETLPELIIGRVDDKHQPESLGYDFPALLPEFCDTALTNLHIHTTKKKG